MRVAGLYTVVCKVLVTSVSRPARLMLWVVVVVVGVGRMASYSSSCQTVRDVSDRTPCLRFRRGHSLVGDDRSTVTISQGVGRGTLTFMISSK